jgi:hypothetical protein
MADFKNKYRELVLPELAKFLKEADPIRLMFSPGTDTYFYISTVANQKGISEREVVQVATKLLFLALIGEGNEPVNNTK